MLIISSLSNIWYLLGIFGCISIISLVKKYPKLAWLLLSLSLFASSLSEFRDEFVLDAPNLIVPLEQIRALGRPLTTVFLGMILLSNAIPFEKIKISIPVPVQYLIILQVVILLKGLEGNLVFAFQAFVVFIVLLIALSLGPHQWLKEDQGISKCIQSIAIASLIFLGVNGIQAIFDSYPITFVHGRFLGTTGNPQHAATLLAVSFPACLYCYERESRWQIKKVGWFVSLIAIAYTLFLTGSRTGLLMTCVSMIFFYRLKVNALFKLLMAFLILYSLSNLFLGFDFSLFTSENAHVTVRYTESFENTRADVWSVLWESFQNHPFFGAPLQRERLGFGENSWLAAGANLGLFGFIPLGIFGWSSVKVIFNLIRISQINSTIFLESSTVIAGIFSLLIGSIFEAFLLGTLTYPLISLIVFLFIGQQLVTENQSLIAVAPKKSIQLLP